MRECCCNIMRLVSKYCQCHIPDPTHPNYNVSLGWASQSWDSGVAWVSGVHGPSAGQYQESKKALAYIAWCSSILIQRQLHVSPHDSVVFCSFTSPVLRHWGGHKYLTDPTQDIMASMHIDVCMSCTHNYCPWTGRKCSRLRVKEVWQ